MFSGIVTSVGTISSIEPRGNGCTMVIFAHDLATAEDPLVLGDSIAVMGACLTVEALEGDRFTVALGKETLDCTTLGERRVGDPLHLERALAVGDRLDGHLVSGHVDGVGTVSDVATVAESIVTWIELPGTLARFVATKGSIAVDGVSLTVNEVTNPDSHEGTHRFRVNLIPYTAAHTVMGKYRPGTQVNLEVDLVARYVQRLVGGSDEL